ncbi:hypothetical protein THRCLA_04572, partial [Thraustotheca clavata]
YAQYLMNVNSFEDAEKYFFASMESCPYHSDLNNLPPEQQFTCIQTLVHFAFYIELYHNDLKQALDIYQRILAIYPSHELAMGNYAMLLHKMESVVPQQVVEYAICTAPFNRLLRAYEAAIEVYPRHGSVLCKYAGWLVKENRFALAEQYYIEAIDASPRSSDIVGHYAVFLHSVKDDTMKANAMYKKAIDIDPSHAMNLTNYAFFLASVNRDIDQAQVFYKRSLAADSKHSNTWFNYGMLFWRELKMPQEVLLLNNPHHFRAVLNYARLVDGDLGEVIKADEFYRKAIELDDNNEALVAYADFLFRHERTLEAEVMYEKAYLTAKTNVCLIKTLCKVKCFNMTIANYDTQNIPVDQSFLKSVCS